MKITKSQVWKGKADGFDVSFERSKTNYNATVYLTKSYWLVVSAYRKWSPNGIHGWSKATILVVSIHLTPRTMARFVRALGTAKSIALGIDEELAR